MKTIFIDKSSLWKCKSASTFLLSSNKRTFNVCLKLMILTTWMFNFVQMQETNFKRHFSNTWVVEIQEGELAARQLALNLGYIYHGKIFQNEDFYEFAVPTLTKRSIHRNEEHHESLSSHPKVTWAEQQIAKRRVKRDLTFDPSDSPNDVRWDEMWYLLPKTAPSMNVQKAWQAGYTGKNVSVTILDDGIERTHPDLHQNYDPLASGDINNHDDDPSPRLNPSNENRHGTRCAGEVAAVANNNICAIGIAYNSKIGGVRMLDGQVTDAVEAASIGFRPEHVDIYSASWGPDDDGRTVDGPAKMARKAFYKGITEGRNGKGSIFVWASGNGGRRQDNCNCDGYTDSIYTLSISSTTQRGTRPWYSESCSSTLAATYSSGSQMDKQIVTTDLRHGCTAKHTGTSASAPLAAAICALALEANPDLTWRDMQHLVVQTAQSDGLDAGDWVTNGVGRKVSHAFGYGLMDAYAMVTKARNWTTVPSQRRCTKSVISDGQTPRVLSSTAPIVVPVQVASCDNDEGMVERLEHVQAELTLRNERRGDLVIHLTSPAGTKSELLGQRRQDLTSQGFTKWAFMSTHFWDEDPRGRWCLEIRDLNQRSVSGSYSHIYRPGMDPVKSTLSLYNLVLYGTKHTDWPEKARLSKPTTTIKAASKFQTPEPLKPITNEPPFTSKTEKTTTIKNADPNCQRPASADSCLVCRLPSILDPVNGHCVRSCSSGRFQVYERVNDAGERKRTDSSPFAKESDFEISEEQTFEDEERFYKGFVCRECPLYCHSCSGPLNTDCVQCVSGATFRKSDSSCVPINPDVLPGPSGKQDTHKFFLLSVIVLALAIVLFAMLFYFCQSRKSRTSCCGSSDISYRYIPSGDGAVTRLYPDDYNLEYHDEPLLSDTPEEKVESNEMQNGLVRKNGVISYGNIGNVVRIPTMHDRPSDDTTATLLGH